MSMAVVLSLALAGAAAAAEKPAASSQTAAEEAPAGPQEVTLSSTQQLPHELTLATLSNGLTILVQENHVAPVATVRCYVKNTGSAYEGQWMGAGLSHVLEHVVAGGSTTRRNEKEIEKIIDTFGGATNAFTTTDMTAFFIDCPAKDVMTAIDLMAGSMQHITFQPQEFARELRVVRRELADGEVERNRVLHQMLSQTVYFVSPARHPVIGYLPVLNRTTNQTIIDFYHQRYIPQNQVFVVVGDVDAAKIVAAVLAQWKQNTRGPDTVINLPPEPEQLSPREAIREMDGSTYDLALAWPTIELANADLYPLDLAAYILAQGESSRLVRQLKFEQQSVLSVHSASYTPHFVRGWFGVFAVCPPDKWRAAQEDILRAVYRLGTELVDPAELARAKKQKAAELVFEAQTVQQSADSLGRSYISAADPLFDQHYVEEIQKVTAEQIRDAARRYLVPQRLNRVMIAPPGGAPKSAQKEIARGETPVRLERLPNGVRVLLKRQPNLPLVNMQAFVLAGSLADTPETAGRSSLLAEMLGKGTARHSAEQIADWFDSVGGQFNTASGRNTIYAHANVLRDDFPQALAILAESFTRPTFPAQEFARVKQLMLGQIARRNDSPRSEMMTFFADCLPAGSPYHIVEGGKRETVERLTVADIRTLHARYFVPNNMIVTVFGDVDPDQALAEVRKNFGAPPAKPDFQPPSFDRPNAIAKSAVFHKQSAKPTGMVVLAFPDPSIRDKQDHAAMVLLDTITSGYSYPGGWLHNELRGAGLVYWVHAQQLTGPAPGFFLVMAQTQPDKIAEVVARIRKNLERAKRGEISDEEFQTAQQQVLALHAQENTTIEAQARQAALDELYGLGFEYEKTFDQRIRAVTKQDVIAAAAKYLGNSIEATLSPQPAAAADSASGK